MVTIAHFSTSYVLLQVSKTDKNQSDVKAYIHKVVPAAEPQQYADFNDKNLKKVRRFEVKKRADDDEMNDNQSLRRQQTVQLINNAFDALKNMTKAPEFRTNQAVSFVDKVLDAVKAFVNGPEFRTSKTMQYLEKVLDIVKEAADGPDYRSGQRNQNIRTDLVHLKKDQPSLVFELKPNFFVDFIKKMLSAQLIEKYMEDMGLASFGGRPFKTGRSKGQAIPKRQYNYKPDKYQSRYVKYN